MSSSERQYYLAKRYEAWISDDAGLNAVWRTKQLAAAGTDLPSTLPLTKLAFPPAFALSDAEQVAGLEWYTTYEDVQGYTSQQLQFLGLTPDEAAAVCAAAEDFFA